MSELFVIGDGFGFVAKILIPKNCVYSFYTEINKFQDIKTKKISYSRVTDLAETLGYNMELYIENDRIDDY
jgi:hypothetical protein